MSVAAGLIIALAAFFVFVAYSLRENPQSAATSWDDFPDAHASLLNKAIPVAELANPTSDNLHQLESAATPVRSSGRPLSATEIYEMVAPSVVLIEVYDSANRLMATGSGFFVTNEGSLVTNLHVIERGANTRARLADGTVADVSGFIAVDREADLVVLRLATPVSVLPLSLATDLPPVGSTVYAIGSPHGLTNTLSDGLVSGHRPVGDDLIVIQTNAAISPGSSGGPLVTDDGRVVGVITAQLNSGQNLNLALPATRVTALLENQRGVTPVAVTQKSPGSALSQSISDDPIGLKSVNDAISKREWAGALRALREIPSDRRGKGYWTSHALVNEQLGNWKGAYDAYGKALLQEPDCTLLLRIAVASKYLSNDRILKSSGESSAYFDRARKACDLAVRMDPDNAEAHSLRGYLEMHLDSQTAVGSFNTAISLRPYDLSPKYNLAMLYLTTNNHAKALVPLQSALELVDRGGNYAIHSFDDAESVSQFTTSESVEVLISLGLGCIHRSEGRFADAIKNWERVLSLEPNNAIACWGLCFTYSELQRNAKHSDSLKWERRAESLGQPNALYHLVTASWSSLYVTSK